MSKQIKITVFPNALKIRTAVGLEVFNALKSRTAAEGRFFKALITIREELDDDLGV